jgi:alkaline phosphatase D
MRIYERYDWGRLARFHVLDSRQYRSHQVCPKPGRGGSNSVTNAECSERLDPAHTMLGMEQERWLARGFASSNAKWNMLTQQTLMAQSSQTVINQEGDGKFWTDGWDGYPLARQRLMDDLQKHKPANPVVISGDVHTFYAANLKRDFYSKASASNPILATEFCGTSVTSSSRPQERTEQYVAQNPHIKYGRSDKRGFMLLDLSPTRIQTHFLALDDVAKADSGISTLRSFVVEDGRTGVVVA